MKATPITLPAALQARLDADAKAQFMAVGNTALLAEPLLGLIASRECPGHVLLQTLKLAMSGQHCIPYLSPNSPIRALTSADLTTGRHDHHQPNEVDLI